MTRLSYILAVGGTLLILSPGAAPEEPWTPELEERGYTVLYAEEPVQALVHVRSAAVDVVLINSPTEICDTVTDFVNTLTKEIKAPPFVLVSSSPSAPTYSAKLGAAAFVPKPCCADELEHVFARMLVKPVMAKPVQIKPARAATAR